MPTPSPAANAAPCQRARHASRTLAPTFALTATLLLTLGGCGEAWLIELPGEDVRKPAAPALGRATTTPTTTSVSVPGLSSSPTTPKPKKYICLRAAQAVPIALDSVATGACSTGVVVLENCGDADARVLGWTSKGTTALDVGALGGGTRVKKGATHEITVSACPTVAGPWTSQLHIDLDGAAPLVVPVLGGADAGCIVPVLNAPTTTPPDEAFVADVSASKSPTGATVQATFTLTPPDAGVLQPTLPDGATMAYSPPIAGPWTLCADLRDDDGHVGCAQACRTVDVVPTARLRVELLWSTPGDLTPHDAGPGAGADLDLHVGLGAGDGNDRDCDGAPDPWFSTTWDAWWATPWASWGVFGDSDDGMLLQDDSDGTGPEVFEVAQPHGTATNPVHYTIAVHGWHDHDFGPSWARVRVFVEGTLVAEFGPQRIAPLDLWTVAKVRWPNALSGDGGMAVAPCHQNGDPCKGGLRWTASGAACLTRCYLPATSPSWGAAPLSSCEP